MAADGEGRPQGARVLSLHEVRLGPPGWWGSPLLAQYQERNGTPQQSPKPLPPILKWEKVGVAVSSAPRTAPWNAQGEAAIDTHRLNVDQNPTAWVQIPPLASPPLCRWDKCVVSQQVGPIMGQCMAQAGPDQGPAQSDYAGSKLRIDIVKTYNKLEV